jgi:hypothetical protein
MDYSLHVQDPSASSAATYLFEEIVAAARKSAGARAMFAFASKYAVDALLEDPEVVGLLRRGTFEMVVGIDAVTTRAALQRLLDASRAFKSFHPKVFWNESGRLFHPKLCYFADDRSATLIVGSGNLTSGGLQSNFEAFSRLEMTRREGERVVQPWDDWLQTHAASLRLIDEEVLSRADRNSLRDDPEAELEDGKQQRSSESGGSSVLIAEVPRSGDRWNQVNFDMDTIHKFFKVQPGSSQRVFLQQCLPGNKNGGEEVRPCVDSGRSQNYRIEIAAGRGIAYPSRGRPILVFLQTARRMFRYQLVLPHDDGHTELENVLRSEAGASAHRVRRSIVAPNDLASAWPGNAVLG